MLGQGDADRLGHPLRRATSEIVVDGRVVEEAWSDALTLELRFEVWPGHNVEPPVRTEMFLTFVNPYGVQMDAINDDVAGNLQFTDVRRDASLYRDPVDAEDRRFFTAPLLLQGQPADRALSRVLRQPRRNQSLQAAAQTERSSSRRATPGCCSSSSSASGRVPPQ